MQHVFGRPFVKRFALCYQTVVCPSVLSVRLSCLSVCLSMTLVYCGQTVGWINLGVQVGFGPGYIVLDGDPADPLTKRGTSAPTVEIYERRLCLCVHMIRGPCRLWPNGWMDQDENWHGGRPRPWPHCVRCGPSYSSPKGAQPPLFSPCLLWPNGRLSQLLSPKCCRPSQLLLSTCYC